MWGWVKELVAPVAGIVTTGMKQRATRKMAEHTLKVNIIENKARLALNEQSHNSSKEMKELEVASPWVRWVIVAHVMALMDVAVIDPERAVIVYAALENIPEWIIGLFLTIFGFYFAVAQLSGVGAKMISTWTKRKK